MQYREQNTVSECEKEISRVQLSTKQCAISYLFYQFHCGETVFPSGFAYSRHLQTADADRVPTK